MAGRQVQGGGLRYTLLAALGWGLLMPSGVSADVYQYRDAYGKIYLTDRPMRGDYKLVKRYSFGTSSRRSASSAGASLAAMKRRRAEVEPVIASVAEDTKLRAELLHAVIRAESAYDTQAVSSKGAAGLMQLMPATAARYGVTDRHDPAQNIRGGATYLRDLLAMFDNDLRLALAAYNAGENAVERYGRQIPPFPETQRYVEKVLTFLGDDRRATATAEQVAQN